MFEFGSMLSFSLNFRSKTRRSLNLIQQTLCWKSVEFTSICRNLMASVWPFHKTADHIRQSFLSMHKRCLVSFSWNKDFFFIQFHNFFFNFVSQFALVVVNWLGKYLIFLQKLAKWSSKRWNIKKHLKMHPTSS